MKLALLGIDDDALALVRWAVEQGGHELVAAFDVGSRAADVRQIAPGVRLSESWESLVLGSLADAVVVGRGGAGLAETTGVADSERRADQFRKLVQAAVPLIVMCPACEAIVGFEIEMICRDTRAVIIPVVPGQAHPAISLLAEIISKGDTSRLGKIEQVALEREQADRSRDGVLVQLAQDTALLRRLISNIQTVSASGAAASVGRDPLGPKPKEPPSLANLSVHLAGEEGLAARWSIGPALGKSTRRLTLIGQRGKAMLHMPEGKNWRLEIAGDEAASESFPLHDEAEHVFEQLTHALSAAEFRDESAWLNACRDQEVAEAVDRSLARGRTIELFNEPHTEEEAFKGVMAMGGCLMLTIALAMVLLAALVEGLQLPLRQWPPWRLWPLYVLVPIVVFLLLQFLQLAVKRGDGGQRQAVSVDKK